ncbi:ribosomal protection-like ABC-F family protein [Lachnoclostridium phytofermentans]|mgnify:FL=1|uniref:ribosomal protection-like ABC-F family protein n=1 Tax=Lachnoclostridium phytofermentans TaxID=66219 RepID=UPI000495C0C0|nr:ABC-F type ribosomal protection protein [Lachnoclostridium phytofermentans]
MAQLNVTDLTFYYDGSYDTIFDNVSFQIDSDWKLGFVGRNGRGKTTFLNLLMKKYEYKGTISSPVSFDYFPFPVTDKSQNTIDIVEMIYPDYELWKVCKELTLLEVDCEVLYRPFETLSNGEQTKVLLAVLFSKENNFLLIDEPTNHLDMNTRIVVMNYLKGKKGFILVSHDRFFLDGCIDHVLAINKANIEVMQGNFSTWWENKKNQDEYELAENEKLKKDIKRLSEAAKRTENWSDQIEKSKIGSHSPDRGFIGHKSAKMMKRAKAIENRSLTALDEKSKLLKNIEDTDELKIIPLKHHKSTLVNVENLSVTYGDRTIFDHINFSISNGKRIVLQGKNGCGKSSILKIILGEDIPCNGKVEIASGLVISYVSQDTSNLSGNLSDFAKEHHLEESLFKALLRKLDFTRLQFEKNIEDFSGGQKKKVLIAKSLCEQAHLYIWDEPLNYIDIFSRMQIEKLIKQYEPTMLLVEHDKTFVNEIATDIIQI